MKKRFLSLLIIALLATNVSACGPFDGEDPDIDEGLHIAADDAQQRLDRDEEDPVTDVQGETDDNFDDEDEQTTSDSDPTLDGPWSEPIEDEYGEPQGFDWEYTTDTEPQGEPQGNEPSYPGTEPTRADFWIDDDTFDLIGYATAIGCPIDYGSEDDPTKPAEIDYCHLGFYTGKDADNRRLDIGSSASRTTGTAQTRVTMWMVTGGDSKTDINGYLTGNIDEPDITNLRMAYIQSRKFWMPRRHLNATLTILERMVADDPECWFRDLGIYHGGQSMHHD